MPRILSPNVIFTSIPLAVMGGLVDKINKSHRPSHANIHTCNNCVSGSDSQPEDQFYSMISTGYIPSITGTPLNEITKSTSEKTVKVINVHVLKQMGKKNRSLFQNFWRAYLLLNKFPHQMCSKIFTLYLLDTGTHSAMLMQ